MQNLDDKAKFIDSNKVYNLLTNATPSEVSYTSLQWMVTGATGVHGVHVGPLAARANKLGTVSATTHPLPMVAKSVRARS